MQYDNRLNPFNKIASEEKKNNVNKILKQELDILLTCEYTWSAGQKVNKVSFIVLKSFSFSIEFNKLNFGWFQASIDFVRLLVHFATCELWEIINFTSFIRSKWKCRAESFSALALDEKLVFSLQCHKSLQGSKFESSANEEEMSQ